MNVLFGGSFDPIHIGHLYIIRTLFSLKTTQKVIIMPTYCSLHKSTPTFNNKLRLSCIKKVLNNELKMYEDRCIVSTWELEQKKKTPTVATLAELTKKYSNLAVCIGSDNLLNFHHWVQPETLLNKASLIVINRNHTENILTTYINNYFRDQKEKIQLVNNKIVPISSTNIRENKGTTKGLPKSIIEMVTL